MYWDMYTAAFTPPHPDMYAYAERCMRRRRHRKVRISRHNHR